MNSGSTSHELAPRSVEWSLAYLHKMRRTGAALLVAGLVVLVPTQVIYFGNQILDEQCENAVIHNPGCEPEFEGMVTSSGSHVSQDLESSKRWRDSSVIAMGLGAEMAAGSLVAARTLRYYEKRHKRLQASRVQTPSYSLEIERVKHQT